LSIFIVVYYGSNPTFYGFLSTRLQSSLSRYFLPVYVFLVILTIYFVDYFRMNKKTKVFFVTSLILTFQIFTLTAAGSLIDLLNTNKRALFINDFVVSTPEKSVFIVKQYDKFVVPYRSVMLMYNEEDLERHPYLLHFYTLLKKDELTSIVSELIADDYNVYMSFESESMRKFVSESFAIKDMNEYFYKVDRID